MDNNEKNNEEEFFDDDIVVLEDENGEPVEYIFLALVEVDELEYAVLTPNEEPENDEEPMEIFLFGYSEDEEGYEVFSEIEDDATYQKVKAEAERVLTEQAEEDDAE